MHKYTAAVNPMCSIQIPYLDWKWDRIFREFLNIYNKSNDADCMPLQTKTFNVYLEKTRDFKMNEFYSIYVKISWMND